MNLRPATLSLGLLLLLAGCASVSSLSSLPRPLAQLYAPVNYQGDDRMPSEVQRVALLPLHGGETAPREITAVLDTMLVTALQRQTRFEVVKVSREDLRQMYGFDDYSSTAALPHGFVEWIAAKYAVDAVVFTDLTVYQPYRPLSLGLRAKLATTSEIRLLWAFDEVFSSENPAMINSVRQYYRQGDRAVPVDPTVAALQSPARFGAVAAEMMFQTLPPR